MTSANERLIAALSGRYRIERELGQGGMANVIHRWMAGISLVGSGAR